jgi:ribonuclease HIII
MLNELPHAFAERMPEAYNAHWGKLKNVNRVLDELHAQAITEVHRATGILDAITDQYAADGRLKSRLPRELRWRSETGGESWTAVAVASVFARARFVQRMQELESQWGMRLNKGAGSPTFADARRFVTVHGFDKLSQVAKLHFRTTEQLRPRA